MTPSTPPYYVFPTPPLPLGPQIVTGNDDSPWLVTQAVDGIAAFEWHGAAVLMVIVFSVGLPPMQYLARWRMQRAARLLADGDATVGAVAFEVGYGSEAAFSRSFKRTVGVSPTEWRRAAGAG